MKNVKISIITVVYNGINTIEDCIKSVISQKDANVEYLVIDGGSTDGTIDVIKKYQSKINHFISEPDNGIYDAMNKGITHSSGDIIGMLNADDYFANDSILHTISQIFLKKEVKIIHGDLDYINETGVVRRSWRSGVFNRDSLKYGWMPPHPTFYCRRELFDLFGLYKLDYGTAADYELMLRFLFSNNIDSYYIKVVMVKMKVGGKSNANLLSRLRSLRNDYRAIKCNSLQCPILTLILKPSRKLGQYFNN